MNRGSWRFSQHTQIRPVQCSEWGSDGGLGWDHKSCFVFKFPMIHVQTRHPGKAEEPHKKRRLTLWLGHESAAEDRPLLQSRTLTSQKWRATGGKRAKRHVWQPSPRPSSTACAHPVSPVHSTLSTLSGPSHENVLQVGISWDRRRCSGSSAGPDSTLHTCSQT